MMSPPQEKLLVLKLQIWVFMDISVSDGTDKLRCAYLLPLQWVSSAPADDSYISEPVCKAVQCVGRGWGVPGGRQEGGRRESSPLASAQTAPVQKRRALMLIF